MDRGDEKETKRDWERQTDRQTMMLQETCIMHVEVSVWCPSSQHNTEIANNKSGPWTSILGWAGDLCRNPWGSRCGMHSQLHVLTLMPQSHLRPRTAPSLRLYTERRSSCISAQMPSLRCSGNAWCFLSASVGVMLASLCDIRATRANEHVMW